MQGLAKKVVLTFYESVFWEKPLSKITVAKEQCLEGLFTFSVVVARSPVDAKSRLWLRGRGDNDATTNPKLDTIASQEQELLSFFL
jgi:hypothetical protein